MIIPAYNEERTIGEVVKHVMAVNVDKEVVIIDDGSSDGTGVAIAAAVARWPNTIRSIRHCRNRGKGAAVRSALPSVTGELTIIQDADLEYDPSDYPRLLAPFASPGVQVVYGSRNLAPNDRSSSALYWGGRLLSWVSNLLFGSRITDEATGYKIMRTKLLKEIDPKCDGFDFCPEVTAQILKRGIEIREVPISYRPRSRAEGKKIEWRDGFRAIWILIRYRFCD